MHMHVKARKEAGLINPDTGDYMELDIFLPQLNLAFEYQVSLINVSLSVQHPDQKKKTKKKKKQLNRRDITTLQLTIYSNL